MPMIFLNLVLCLAFMSVANGEVSPLGKEPVFTNHPYMRTVRLPEGTSLFGRPLKFSRASLDKHIDLIVDRRGDQMGQWKAPIPGPGGPDDLPIDTGVIGKILDFFSEDPSLKWLYKQDAGVKERYRLDVHHAMVLQRFLYQQPFFNLQKYSDSSIPNGLERFLVVLLALHDIGKPFAVALGDKSRQHEFTEPIVDHILQILLFTESERKIALALLHNEDFGDLLQGRIDCKTFAKQFRAMHDALGLLSLPLLYRLQRAFFISDTSSYPGLVHKLYADTPIDQEMRFLVHQSIMNQIDREFHFTSD